MVSFEGEGRILVLDYEGEYRDGSAGSPDADCMAAEALKHCVVWKPDGIVFDFSRLEYNWGNGLSRVVSIDPEPLLPMCPRTYVGGERSMAGLSSLLQNSTIHTQRDEAIAVCRQRAVELARLEDEFDVSLKMYILVKESVETGYAITAAAHAAVAMTCTYSHTWEVRTWLCGIFRKVVCRVTDAEFEKAKTFPNRVVMTESALGGQEVALGFMPRTDWPKAFRFYRLY